MKVWAWQLADYLRQGQTRETCVEQWGFEVLWSRPLTDEQIAKAIWNWRLWQKANPTATTRKWAHRSQGADDDVIAAKVARRAAYFEARRRVEQAWEEARASKLRKQAERRARREARRKGRPPG